MKKLYISIILIIPILTSCSSAVKKEPIFYSENNKSIIPLCPNRDLLFVDPDDFSMNGPRAFEVAHPYPFENFSNSLSDFGVIIGEIVVSYSGLTAGFFDRDCTYISDKVNRYYIVYDEHAGNLFLDQYRIKFGDQNYLRESFKSNTKIPELFRIKGVLDGLEIDIDLYNSITINDGKSILFPIRLKNLSNNTQSFSSSTDKISFFLQDANRNKKIENQLYLYNYCLNKPIDSINEMRSGEERLYYAKADFKDENESAGIQVVLSFSKITIDGLKAINIGSSSFKKETDQIKKIWGGSFQKGINGKTTSLIPAILVNTN